jgi:hypothetical protein
MSEENFKHDIKSWIELDNQQKQYNVVLKDIRQKKNNVLDKINNHVNDQKLQDAIVKISDGRIKFTVVKNVKPLTLQYVKQCLTDKIQDTVFIEKLMNYIKDNRDYSYSDDIKRYYNSN